jgi:hypothetical protein
MAELFVGSRHRAEDRPVEAECVRRRLGGWRGDRRRGHGRDCEGQRGSSFALLHVHSPAIGHATTLTLAHRSASWNL